MADAAVRFDDVHRSFGSVDALAGLCCTVPEGSITALLGRNGAGKTTALRSLMGLLRPDRGTVQVLGQDATQLDVATKRRVGYVSERQTLDPRMTVAQLLQYARSFHRSWDDALVRELFTRFDVAHDARVASLSLGAARKLSLIVAVAPRPDLLVLDEPAANLDVVVRREFLAVILEMFRARGLTVWFSTHLLTDVERIADRVVMIEAGRRRVEQDLDDLKDQVKALRVIPNNGHALPALHVPGLLREKRLGKEVLLTVEGFTPELVQQLQSEAGANVQVMDLALEDIFLAYAGES